MVDKIQKNLDKFSKKEKIIVKCLLQKIQTGETEGINIKKLKGNENLFRIKKGKIRIIYRTEEKKVFILTIERRSEKTYKNI